MLWGSGVRETVGGIFVILDLDVSLSLCDSYSNILMWLERSLRREEECPEKCFWLLSPQTCWSDDSIPSSSSKSLWMAPDIIITDPI